MTKYIRTAIGICTLLLTCISFSFSDEIAENPLAKDFPASSAKRIVRVFYPLQSGLTERDENGRYSGYTYDYLMRIAQLAGWEYEFTVVETTNENLTAGLQAVKEGELDLAATMAYYPNLEQEYLFSAAPYGEAHYTLITLSDNQLLNSRTLPEYPNLRVALIETAEGQNRLFYDYCLQEGISYQAIYAQNNQECKKLIESGQADAMIGKDIAFKSGYKAILWFERQSFYFASSKENQILMSELDKALTTIGTVRPSLQLELYIRYFMDPFQSALPLTAEELVFIQEAPTIRVAVPIDRAPVQDCDESGRFSGIMVDVLEAISQKSGLRFQLLAADNRTQAEALLRADKADIIAGMPHYYGEPELLSLSDVFLTSPILSMPIVRVSHAAGAAPNGKVLLYENIKQLDLWENMQFENDVAQILKLIDKRQGAEGYVNGYMAQYYLEQGNFRNIIITPTPYSNYNVCLGVGRSEDMRLISILEQSIAVLSTEQLEHIIYQNTSRFKTFQIWDLFQRNPLPIILPCLLVLILISVLLLALFLKSRCINRFISAEGTRYKFLAQMDGLTNIFNHATFCHLSAEYLAETVREPNGAMLIMDIDHFKGINDTMGHPVGDEVLRRLSGLLTEVFRTQDLIGRLGGDEFAVLMKTVSDREVLATRCAQLARGAAGITDRFQITLSIGAVLFEGNTDFEDLFRQTDDALYEVKNAGRNGYRIHCFASSSRV